MVSETPVTWLEIHLGSIKRNIQRLNQLTGCPVMPIVKANAYGHGAVQVSRAAVEAGVEWLGVARVEEAIELRKQGIRCNLLVMGYTPPTWIEQVVQNQISVAIYDLETAAAYSASIPTNSNPLRLHIKVDTGMGRLGIPVAEAEHFVKKLEQQSGVLLEGIFTHFARSDELQSGKTEQQIGLFSNLLDRLNKTGFSPRWVHAANSAGAIYHPGGRFNLVRSGVGIYGLHPGSTAQLPTEFEKALSWKARLVSVKLMPPGSGIGYGSTYITRGYEKIGVIPIGYGDGFRRIDGNQVLIKGKRVPVVGRVCMDQCMVLLDSVPGVDIGEPVVIIGRQDEQEITMEELANLWGTINYEVATGLAARLPREYIE